MNLPQVELLPDTSKIVIGQRVYTGLYGRGYGTVTHIEGEQSPESCRGVLGVMRMGGTASVTVCFDGGQISEQLPETILRGVQWTIFAEVASAEAVARAIVRSQLFKAEKKAEAAEAKSSHLAAAEAFRTNPDYAHLSPLTEKYDSKGATNNIRKHLKKLFPGVKFSVRNERGSSVAVRWADGPTTKAVDRALAWFKAGRFDGMTDSYEYSANPFGDVFGSVTYLSTSREASAALDAYAIEAAFTQYADSLQGVERITPDDLRNGSARNVRVCVPRLWRVDDLSLLVSHVKAHTTGTTSGFVTQWED